MTDQLNSEERARLQELEEKQALTDRNRHLQSNYLIELYTNKNFDYIANNVSPEFRGWMYPEGEKGYELVQSAWTQVWHAFPDLELKILETFAEGDLSCCIFEFHATHTGQFNGIPATGKRIVYKIVDTNRFDDDGKFIDAWPMPDTLGLMQQMGVMSDDTNPIGLDTDLRREDVSKLD